MVDEWFEWNNLNLKDINKLWCRGYCTTGNPSGGLIIMFTVAI